MHTDLKYFLDSCAALREKTTDCDKSREAFSAAASVPEAVAAFRLFWAEVVEQIPEDFIRFMTDLYPAYRDGINAAGVYFNEPPADTVNSLVFVGGLDTVPEIVFAEGRMRVIVVTKAKVTVGGHIRCRNYSGEAVITCLGHSRLTLERGTAHARDRSSVTGSGEIHTYGSARAWISGGTLHDNGHNAITACGRAKVYSPADRNITLHDKALLIIQ